MIVDPTSHAEGIICGRCGYFMQAERGELLPEEGEHVSSWMWWRCVGNPDHVTRAIPLPVQMARSM